MWVHTFFSKYAVSLLLYWVRLKNNKFTFERYDIFINLFNKKKIPCSSRNISPLISLLFFFFFEVRLNFSNNVIWITASSNACLNQLSLSSYVYYLIFFCPGWNAIMMTKISWTTVFFSNINKKTSIYKMKWTGFKEDSCQNLPNWFAQNQSRQFTILGKS